MNAPNPAVEQAARIVSRGLVGGCGYAVVDSDGEQAPCDRPVVGWRWYQNVGEHEDMLDAACDWHQNVGGNLIANLLATTQGAGEGVVLAPVKQMIRDLGDMACIGCTNNTCPACNLAAHITNEVHVLAAGVEQGRREGGDYAAQDTTWRFLNWLASNAAYNGADDPGQRFYDWGLNPWLAARFADFLLAQHPPVGGDDGEVRDG